MRNTFIFVFLLLLSVAICQQWYQPNSNPLTASQFSQKILHSPSTYKIVKYFTPYCKFCRFVKAVTDKLKQQKQWCFQIYDFNCQKQPQHCRIYVRADSFPFIGVYDQRGEMTTQVHGLYPEIVMRDLFNKVDQDCRRLKKGNNGQVKPPQAQITNSNKQETNVHQDQVKDGQGQIKQQNKQIRAQSEVIKGPQRKQSVLYVQPEPQQNRQVFKYVFYSLCTIIAIFFICSAQQNKQVEYRQQQQEIPLQQAFKEPAIMEQTLMSEIDKKIYQQTVEIADQQL